MYEVRYLFLENFKKSILSQLDNLNNNNPKAYWKLIESLKDKDNDALPLSKDEFFNHFKSFFVFLDHSTIFCVRDLSIYCFLV
jgi:hypothetical protein